MSAVPIEPAIWTEEVGRRAASAKRLALVLANLGGQGQPFEASIEALNAACGVKSLSGKDSAASRGLRALSDAGLIEITRPAKSGRNPRPTTYRLRLPEAPAVAPGSLPAHPAPASTPPRPITPAARRLINDRLETVYDDERGYVDAWTDKRLAEEIGCPLKWVAEVRELMFGPLKVNPALAAEAAAAIEVVNRAAAQLADMKSERAALAGLLAEMDQKCARIEGDLGAAMAAVRRIEEAVRP